MAGLFSLFGSSNSDEKYEKILAELEEKIEQKELSLSEIKINKGSSLTFYLYSFSSYVVYCILYLTILRNPDNDDWTLSLIKVAPLILFPIFIYLYRSTSNFYYERRISSETEQLAALKTKLKITIEEFKKSSSYYKTKSILERYGQDGNLNQADLQQMRKRVPIPQGQPANRQGIQSQPMMAPNGQRPMTQMPISLKQRPPQAPNIQVEGGQPWFGKLMDAIVGEEEKKDDVTKFALICKNCFAHNGLVSANDYNIIQYTCPKCGKFNPSRRSQRRKSVENLGLTEEEQEALKASMARSLTSAPKPNLPKQRKNLPENFLKANGGQK